MRDVRADASHPAFSRALVGIGLLCCGLVLREAYRERHKPHAAPPTIDARFAPLVAAVAGAPRVGFVALEADEGPLTRRVSLQFALAPTLVVGDDDPALLLGLSAARVEDVVAYAARARRPVLATVPSGYAILGPATP